MNQTKQYKNTYVKFLTNIPEIVTFKFGTPKEFEGQYGIQYNYGVEWKGVDAYMSTTERLNDMLQTIGDLQGKTLQILKYEDGTTKLWKIMDAVGNDITPQTIQKPRDGANLNPQDNSKDERIRQWALKVSAEITEIRNILDEMQSKIARFSDMETDIDGLVGALITDENRTAFELHKSMTRPIRNEYDKRQNVATPDDEIPIIDVE